MATVVCPHCGASNVDAGEFCVSCGKALPVSAGPQLYRDSELAGSAAGREVQSEALAKKVRSARGALLAVAIIQGIAAGLLIFVSSVSDDPELNSTLPILITIVLAIGAVYVGLWFWAKASPFPAAVVGLVVYVTLILGGALLDPASLLQGILIKAIIIAVLVKAVSAGAQHRKLMQSM